MWAGGEPIDEVARGFGGLVGLGLNVSEEEGEHEKGCRKDEEKFDGGDRALEEHDECFVLQSTVQCQVEFCLNDLARDRRSGSV